MPSGVKALAGYQVDEPNRDSIVGSVRANSEGQ